MSEAISPPIVVVTDEDCAFHRDVTDAVRSGIARDARVFDARGRRLLVEGDGLGDLPNADGAEELAGLLRGWLGSMDALRESTANWSLALLVRAAVDHLGYG